MRDAEHPSDFDFVPRDEFERDPHDRIEHLLETGRATVLTVNGNAEAVVQSAEAYQRLLDRLDRAETIVGIRRGLDEVDRGETVSLEEAFHEIREQAAKRRRSA